MSPEERANRLFNRVMVLAEAGRQDSVQFFSPDGVGSLCATRHPGRGRALPRRPARAGRGDATAALAQADSIQRAAPSHLFIYILRAHAYQQDGNTSQERRAYADFLRNEPSEMTKSRPEYGDHSDALTNFKAEASRQASRSPS